MLAAELIKCFNSKFVPAMHFAVTATFLLFTFKINFQITILAQLITFYVFRNIQSKFLTWTLGVLWIIYINTITPGAALHEDFNIYFETYKFVVLLAWNILRGLSFILDRQEALKNNIGLKQWNLLDFMRYAGYMFYFPTFIFGPFIIYGRYSQLFSDNFREKDVIERLKNLIFGLLRIGFWILFVNVSLHFFYFYYLQYDHEAVLVLSSLGLYGFGYLMGLYFQIHYIITYGLGITFLKYDSISPPRQPICIARVHFYSYMWRYFDEGLYEFLLKYIYMELQTRSSSGLRKLFASFVTFVFIFIWHGLSYVIFVWSALNFLCVVIEKVFKEFWKSDFFQNNVTSRLSVNNQKRLYGLLGCHIYIPSIMSNFYFFAGTATGHHFMITTYTSGLKHYLILTAVCYCIFQTSEWIFQIEANKKKKELK
ncbi:protein-cysteine N-palmitoyltransferase Rasp isoform X2 [Condylostylus longicornis]|nr:protein-cysteine N-palmitoyltransferase Rasp isoform X2 [Condylostylus longicornis]XP_055382899.1 protein-cysteine N-palmitoyltransferase Rasp isoform X2 [Condylostylus longicornis]